MADQIQVIPEIPLEFNQPIKEPFKYRIDAGLLLSYPVQLTLLSLATTPFERIQVIKQCRLNLAHIGYNYTSTGSIVKGEIISDQRVRIYAVFQGFSTECVPQLGEGCHYYKDLPSDIQLA